MPPSIPTHLKALLCASAVLTSTLCHADLALPYGVCSHLTTDEYSVAGTVASSLVSGNVKVVRSDFPWWGIEPTQNTWTWDKYDTVVNTVVAPNGLQLIAILGWPPSYGFTQSGGVNYIDLAKFDVYVRAVVNRYKNTVHTWELMNEVNLNNSSHGSVLNQPGQEWRYVQILQQTYNSIKSIDPTATVLFSGLANDPDSPWGIDFPYITACYDAGAKPYFDAMNIHPYRSYTQSAPESDISLRGRLYEEIADLRSLMDSKSDSSKPIWVTEIGYPTDSVPASHYVTEAQQAKYLPRTLLSLLQSGVQRTLWYEFLDNPANTGMEAHFGIRRNTTTDKPAWPTYRTLVSLRPPGSGCLNPTNWHSSANDVFYAKWLRPDGKFGWALWTTGATQAYQFDAGALVEKCVDQNGASKSYTTVSGNVISLSINDTVTYVQTVVSSVPNPTNYYRVKNHWTGSYLFQSSTSLAYGSPAVTDQTSHWLVEVHNGNRRLKNRATGQYANIEHLLTNVEVTGVSNSAWSAQWRLLPVSGYFNLQNVWQGTLLNNEIRNGYVQCTNRDPSFWSAQWLFEVTN